MRKQKTRIRGACVGQTGVWIYFETHTVNVPWLPRGWLRDAIKAINRIFGDRP